MADPAPDAPFAAPAAPAAPASALARLEHAVVRANQAIVVALMASMAVLVFVNVVTRYLLNFSIIWVEEFTQYEMIWVAYLGAGLALREGRHVAVDSLAELLPPPARRLLRLAIAITIALFLATLVVLGFRIVEFTWNQETPVMNVPTGAPYLAIPLGAAAWLLHLLLFWRRFVARDFEAVGDPEAPDEAAQALEKEAAT